MPLLDPKTWQDRSLAGPAHTVTEPATGDALGTVTLAAPEDVGAAARAARAAQGAWARAPHFQRAQVLRRAGDLFTEHADDLRLGHLHTADGGGRDTQDAGGLLTLQSGTFPQV
ncbi:aldehyde dehydrogenase family protein, partial [Streptomyces sp. NPDC003233]